MKIEAIFGGVLALFVLAVALYALATTTFAPKPPPANPGSSTSTGTIVSADENTVLCQCFNDARDLAGSEVGVMSSQYRTGFEQCRAVLDERGGDAWTAGWNARLSAKPYESSCRAYLNGAG